LSKRIYVGNLPWSVTKVRLEELFSSFGSIEDALVMANKYTGRSRGFGFVTFAENASADKAISEMNEKEVDGRKLVVKEARPLEERKAEQKKEKEEKVPRKRRKKEDSEE
jgi:RNA recognition motif-containing protein